MILGRSCEWTSLDVLRSHHICPRETRSEHFSRLGQLPEIVNREINNKHPSTTLKNTCHFIHRGKLNSITVIISLYQCRNPNLAKLSRIARNLLVTWGRVVQIPVDPLKAIITRDDSQRRFLAQHSVAMLERYCNHSKQCRNNVVTLCCAKNLRCESSRLTLP